MADHRGFLKVRERELPPYRPVPVRIMDWREVQPVLADDEARLHRQAGRCMDCGIPFCPSGCPLGNLIPDWNDLVHKGQWAEASDRLHATNNFPEFTGRICPAPCESACVLGINQDPVTIKNVEVTIAEEAFGRGLVSPQVPARLTGSTVAVVGSGPAGLAAAQQLTRAGHTVAVYERDDAVGGLLRYGVPDFKLDKGVVQRRIDLLAEEGVEFVTGVEAGRDVSAAELRERFDAIVVCIGSTIPRDLPVPGRELDGIHFAMEYLEQRNRFVAGDYPDGTPISARGKHVVIIGGGDTGADCLGNSHREEPASVTQFELLGEPPPERPDDRTPWPSWPLILRSSAAHEEGGERRFSVMTTSFTGQDGRVTHLHGNEVGPPPAFEKVEGTDFTIPADLVLLAMGFLHPQREGLVEQLGVELDPRGNVAAPYDTGDGDHATSIPGVFAAGDARRGQSLIVWAIAEGRKAARAADRYLGELDGGEGDEDLVGAVLGTR